MDENRENAPLPEPPGQGEEALPPPPAAAADAPPEEEQMPVNPSSTTPEAMEIHHHPHIHHKKKWKEYLFEFFMLFLAVSTGFFVENQREHYVEHLRAKDYAAMLRKDLAADTVIINIIIGFRNEQAKRYAQIKTSLNSVPFEKVDQRQFVQLVQEAGKYLHLLHNNGTLQQLKSSGSLRYFRDTTLVYTLTSYEEDLRHGEYVQSEEREFFTDKVLPFKMQHFNDAALGAAAVEGAAGNYPAEWLVDFDKKTRMEFYNLMERSASFNEMLGEAPLTRHKTKAALLIEMLKKEYDLN
ncbi:MAG TPA: hypothetical protein VL307_12915 [Chitinophagaceae bacterium]|nr:hypothetical protein [Chitinophagaceae bacterium]